MTRITTYGCAVVAAALLAAAMPASAATISRADDGALVITAAVGDQDRVVLAPATDGTEGYISLYDRAGLSTVTAEGCETPGDRLVNCRFDAAGVRALLGDGADEFSAGVDYPQGHGVAVNGGEGNDTIGGSYGSDTLDGGAGEDTVNGSEPTRSRTTGSAATTAATPTST
jgi:hypothetical protein